MGLTMGLFSFLFGGKKKPKAEAQVKAPAKPALTEKPAAKVAASVLAASVSLPAGVVQAKLRLRMAASLRTGEHAAAYEAAQALAEMQAKAGRKTAARVWVTQAERIKASLPV
jgi:hypothetical protein